MKCKYLEHIFHIEHKLIILPFYMSFYFDLAVFVKAWL